MIILYASYVLFLHFEIPCTVYSPNLDEVSVCFKFLVYHLLLMIFVVPSMFLILSLFLSCSRFFIISANRSGLFLLYIEIYAKGCMLLCFLAVFSHSNWAIGQMSWVFANGVGDRGSIPGWVIPKTQKMVLDAALLNTQHYKVQIKGEVEQSRGRSSTLGVVAIEKGAFGSPLTKVANLVILLVFVFCLFKSHIHKCCMETYA